MLKSRLRPSSITLAASLLFALGGIFAIDRALADASRSQLQIEAVESAARVEGFLTVHAQALQSVQGLYLDPERKVTEDEFRSLLESLSQYAPAFRRVWLTDSLGIIQFQELLGPEGTALPPGLIIDTIRTQPFVDAIQRARQTKRTQISSMGTLATGERGLLLVQPLFIKGDFIGYAGGTLTSQSILNYVQHQRHRRFMENRHHPRCLGDTLHGATVSGVNRRFPVDSAAANIRIPSARSMAIDHDSTGDQ